MNDLFEKYYDEKQGFVRVPYEDLRKIDVIKLVEEARIYFKSEPNLSGTTRALSFLLSDAHKGYRLAKPEEKEVMKFPSLIVGFEIAKYIIEYPSALEEYYGNDLYIMK